jgi:DNA-binding NarL/FixJ family response regulator
MPTAVPVNHGCYQGERVADISVLLVGRQRTLTQSLAERIEVEPGLVVAGVADTLVQARASVVWLCCDVVLLDSDVEHSGAELAALLGPVAPAPRIVLLADATREPDLGLHGRAGHSRWVDKADDLGHLFATVRGVAAGEVWIPPRLLGSLVHSYRQGELPGRSGEALHTLSEREREVLARMAAGRNRSEIASELVLSESTVRTHAQNVLRKLGVHSSLAAVAVARRAGLTAPGSGPVPAGSGAGEPA